jgi:hypothetical protein
MTQAPPPPATPKTNGLAIASLVLGIASIVCLGCVAGIPAIICGHLALKQIAARGEGGAGMAKAGLIIGYIITILCILLGIAWVVLMCLGMAVPRMTQMNIE